MDIVRDIWGIFMTGPDTDTPGLEEGGKIRVDIVRDIWGIFMTGPDTDTPGLEEGLNVHIHEMRFQKIFFRGGTMKAGQGRDGTVVVLIIDSLVPILTIVVPHPAAAAVLLFGCSYGGCLRSGRGCGCGSFYSVAFCLSGGGLKIGRGFVVQDRTLRPDE